MMIGLHATYIKHLEQDFIQPMNCQALDGLEYNSSTVKGATNIGQDNEAPALILWPLKTLSKGLPNSWRDQDIARANQSLRILTNLTAAGALHSNALDEIIHTLLTFTAAIVSMDFSDCSAFIVKSLLILKKLVDTSRCVVGKSYIQHCVAFTERYSQVVGYTIEASGRVPYESTACIVIMLSQAAVGLKTPVSAVVSETEFISSQVEEILKQMLDHGKTSGIVDVFCKCLVDSGLNLMSSSSNMLHVAYETCKALWAFIEALEFLSMKGHTYLFPLDSLWSKSPLWFDISGNKHDSVLEMEMAKIIDTIARTFVESKPMQVAIYYCIHQGPESAFSAAIQIFLRSCLSRPLVCNVLCGLPNCIVGTTAINGGADGTIISEIFSLLLQCASSSREELSNRETSKQKCKLSNPHSLVLHSCLTLATIAQCFKSAGRISASHILTTSQKKQCAPL